MHQVPFALPEDRLRGRVAVVTGASRGLGAGLVARFAEAGLAVGACARTIPALAPGSPGVARSVDVGDAAAVDRFATEVVAALGPIDLWVNDAGVLEPMGPLRDSDPAAFDQALRVNVGGVANGTRTFAREARRWEPARRVLANISSGAATTPYAGWAAYCATKAAVEQLTEVVALEEPGLVAHAVSPGVVDTDMQAQIRAHDASTFPAIERFRRLHEEGTWNTPAWVADHLLGLLAGTLEPGQVRYRVPDEPR